MQKNKSLKEEERKKKRLKECREREKTNEYDRKMLVMDCIQGKIA